MNKKIILNLKLFLPAFLICMVSFSFADKTGDFYEEVSRFNRVLSEINLKYVEEVDPSKITDAALDGIRNILDPHTTVFSPKDYDDLKVTTDGQFGGIGITISVRDNQLTVISPLQGTPAFAVGLQAGDRIIKIEGKSTRDLPLDKAVEKLRGKVGTNVNITIAREGVTQPIDYTIKRAIIVVHAVPYAGFVSKDIGYIKLAQFSQKTVSELEQAIKDLKKQGMKKIIMDLRFNPGGLLNQAVEVSELFLKKGNVVVSTKGRTQETESVATKNGILNDKTPLVVLVNEGSASASEIVAGAIQDWDRGVILGKATFGKGSVQTIFPLNNQGHALKLTTALYYLPMGRCINKPENAIKTKNEAEANFEDYEGLEEGTKADTAAADTQVYHTAGGRKMFGDGGITPDIEVDLNTIPWIVQLQERMTMFFKFAIRYRPLLEKSGYKLDENFEVPDSLYTAFKNFCAADTTFSKVKTNAQATADIIEDILLKEQNFLGDSSETISSKELAQSLTELKKQLHLHRELQFDNSKSYILDAIKRELLAAAMGDEARIAHGLKTDKQVLEAIKILNDKALYKKTLTPSKK